MERRRDQEDKKFGKKKEIKEDKNQDIYDQLRLNKKKEENHLESQHLLKMLFIGENSN